MLQKLGGQFFADSFAAVLYPVWFVLAPAVSIAVAVLGMRICGVLLPNLLHMVSGGRIVARPAAQAEAASADAPMELASTRTV